MTSPKEAPDYLDELLRHMYTTAVQDADGVRAGRKGYRMRYDEVPAAFKQQIAQHIAEQVEAELNDVGRKLYLIAGKFHGDDGMVYSAEPGHGYLTRRQVLAVIDEAIAKLRREV